MNTKIFLPMVAVSALTLAACERAQSPDIPNPDADAQVQVQPEPAPGMTQQTAENEEEVQTELAEQDIGRTVEEIEQEASETFESIMEDMGRTSEGTVDMGTSAMQSISDRMAAMGADGAASLEQQIDAIIEGVANFSTENMTDEQRIQVVASARTAAEQAARDLGHSDAEVINAGDTAEERARDLMGL